MSQPCIYYFCPDLRGTVGGVKIMYRHVDILNRNRIKAAVLHSIPGFRCTWFENQTNIAYVERTKLAKEDIVVFPEPFLAYFTDFHNPSNLRLRLNRVFSKSRHKYYVNELSKAPVRKVIFNQCAYFTFKDIEYSKEYVLPYLRSDVVATICVSQDSYDYLKYVFPGIPLHRVRLSANRADFYYHPEKKRQIAFMADRSKEDANQIFNILKARGAMEGFQLVPIKDKTEKQVAQILRESLLFLSFGKAEGFSLPPIEAMLCGCIVVGYHGRAGLEYLHPSFSYPVEIGDIIGFARKVEDVIAAYNENPSLVMEKGKRASEDTALMYNPPIEEADLIGIWSEILKSDLDIKEMHL